MRLQVNGWRVNKRSNSNANSDMEICEIPEIYNEQICNEKGDGPHQSEINDKDIKDVTEELNIKEERETKPPDYNQQLRDRIIMLRATLYELKKQLKEEKESWNREIQHICNSQQETYTDNFRFTQNMTYEEIKQMHQESKATLQRQLAITNYKRRLLEVENMCNMELMRVKQSVKFLQPLQDIVSEWNCDNGNTNGLNIEQEIPNQEGGSPSLSSQNTSESDSDEKTEKITNGPLELISSKLYNEMNDMFNVLSAHCQATIPNWNEENALQAISAGAVSECGQGEQH